ncbi:hypothetical protein KSF78_0009635 [Schistosoma japonicum]|nr:hypothetical protein KSF78_0009635 [Schistosoma japonicum]
MKNMETIMDCDFNCIGVMRCPSCDYFDSDKNLSHMRQCFYSGSYALCKRFCLVIKLFKSIKTLVYSHSNNIGLRRCSSCDHYIFDTNL